MTDYNSWFAKNAYGPAGKTIFAAKTTGLIGVNTDWEATYGILTGNVQGFKLLVLLFTHGNNPF